MADVSTSMRSVRSSISMAWSWYSQYSGIGTSDSFVSMAQMGFGHGKKFSRRSGSASGAFTQPG
jgi:hypothetical protein